MPPIKVNHVLSCNSEDTVHKAENMLVSDHYRKWKSAQTGEKQISLVLQLEKSSVIHSIDIGNEGSAFVEILVGRSSDPIQKFEVLLVSSSFMSPLESRQATSTNRVRMFGSDKLSQTVSKSNWDLVKIVCTQPFNKSIQYGLSFIVLHSPPDMSESTSNQLNKQPTLGSFKLKSPEESKNQVTIGSWFAKRKSDSQEVDPVTGPVAIRSAVSGSTSNTDTNPIMPKKIMKIIKDKGSPVKDVASDSNSFSNKKLSPEQSASTQNQKTNSSFKKNIENNTSENGNSLNSAIKTGTPFNNHKHDIASKKAVTTTVFPLNGKTDVSQKLISQKSSNPKVSNKKHAKPFRKIMEHVVFVLSGYQNPQRGQIRDKAIEMGGKFKPDWDKDCTHLICAFMNTPKFQQVQKKGGKIVKEKWIVECFKQRKYLPWKQFQLGNSNRPDTSESDEAEDEPTVVQKVPRSSPSTNTPNRSTSSTSMPSTSKSIQATSENVNTFNILKKINPDELDTDEIYEAATDVESDSGCETETEMARIEAKKTLKSTPLPTPKMDTSKLPLPSLPDLFQGINFLLYGDIDAKKKKILVRYITGCSGRIEEYMSNEVKYVLTYSKWIQDFTDALKENKMLRIVKPKWVFECIEQGCFIPPLQFFVSKR